MCDTGMIQDKGKIDARKEARQDRRMIIRTISMGILPAYVLGSNSIGSQIIMSVAMQSLVSGLVSKGHWGEIYARYVLDTRTKFPTISALPTLQL